MAGSDGQMSHTRLLGSMHGHPFLRGSHTMEVRSHNDKDNDPSNSRAIPYDALNVGLGDIGKIKGIYLASGTRSGCLTIMNFEQLYCFVNGPNSDLYDERNCWHICADRRIDVVRWNPTNEDEVCCASEDEDKILFYDMHHAEPEPIRILQRGESQEDEGFSDIAFFSEGSSWLLASAFGGGVYAWDLRMGNIPFVKFSSNITYSEITDNNFTSVETDIEERIIFGGTARGCILSWDIRGGTQSSPRYHFSRFIM